MRGNRRGPQSSGFAGHRLALEQIAQGLGDTRRGNAPLSAAIAVAEGDGVVAQGLAVHGDTERCTGLILATVATADGPLLIVEYVEAAVSARDRSPRLSRACRRV